jgi:hypothetical protein
MIFQALLVQLDMCPGFCHVTVMVRPWVQFLMYAIYFTGCDHVIV